MGLSRACLFAASQSLPDSYSPLVFIHFKLTAGTSSLDLL